VSARDLEHARAEVLTYAKRWGMILRPGASRDSGTFHDSNAAEVGLRMACVQYAQALEPWATDDTGEQS
jgi:hypothetical protein